MMKTTRCTSCYSEFTDEELRDALACPNCKTRSVPMRIADDVEIKLNWHELRILTVWATNWANAHGEEPSRLTLQRILNRLHRQYPDKAPLTIYGEVVQLRKELDTQVDTNVPPDPLVPE